MREKFNSRIQAFSDGINEYVSTLKILPKEFILTGNKFENWTVTDTVLIGKKMGLATTDCKIFKKIFSLGLPAQNHICG